MAIFTRTVLTIMLVVVFTNSNFAAGRLRVHERASTVESDNEDKECHQKRVLIVSFDGFRWNYLERTSTPNFDKFKVHGVQARYGLNNSFITKTFPNHYTLATGMWEENHDIVANAMFDPVLNQTFSTRNASAQRDPAWFDMGGEPIWVTNQLRGTGHSGVVMWVGNLAPVRDTLPTKYVPFMVDFKNETKVETLIKWFKEDCNMNLGMMYFRQPDHYGHLFGPESEQITQMIGGLDELVGYLLRRFEEEGLLDSMNIILTSDHGFAATPEQKIIDLDDFINPETRHISDISPVAAIWPHAGYFKEIYDNLTTAAAENGHFIVYKKEDIPEHFHYKNSRRVAPILVIAKEFYSFTAMEYGSFSEVGNHGYDNRLRDMHPFFLAMGPDFKTGFAVDSFNSVDIYPLMCHLLKVSPPPNNGTMDIVSTLLKPVSMDKNHSLVQSQFLVPIVTVASLIVVSLIIAAFFICHKKQAEKSTSLSLNDGMSSDTDEETALFNSESAKVPLL